MTIFNEKIKEAQTEHGVGGGNRFRFQRGDNRVRVLDGGDPIATHFVENKAHTCFGEKKGCPFHGDNKPKTKEGKDMKPSVKFVVYLLDKNAKESAPMHLAFLPFSVVKQIDLLQNSEDYAFEKLPMPYDLVIKYDPDADPNSMYITIPTPKREEVSKEVLKELESKKPVKEVVQAIKDKAIEANKQTPESGEINAADISF